jgi:hypothetical protein
MNSAAPQSSAVDSRVRATVTFVHGTFAHGFLPLRWLRSATIWTQKSALREALKNVSTIVDPPPTWSGANTFRGRLRGADEVARSLRATVAKYPGAHHFVVAHSHGGTVAMLALRDPSLAQHISGVVCLATPFPAVSVIPPFGAITDATMVAVSRSTLTIGILGISLVALLMALPSGAQDLDEEQLIRVVESIHIGIWWLTYTFIGLGIVWTVTPWLCRLKPVAAGARLLATTVCVRVERFHGTHRLPIIAATPILVVRAPGDEASGLLVASYFVTWIARKARHLALILLLLLALLGDPDSQVETTLVFGTALAVAAVVLIAIALMALDAFQALTLGWDLTNLPIRAATIRVSTESVPPGFSEVFQAHAAQSGWSHALYENEHAILAVVQWIERQMNGERLEQAASPSSTPCPR